MTKRYAVKYWHPHCSKCADRGVALGDSLLLTLEEAEALYDACPRCFRAQGVVETKEAPTPVVDTPKKTTLRCKNSEEEKDEDSL